MKKLFVTVLLLMVFVLPIIAQVDHDYNPNDSIPGSGFSLTKDSIPPKILKVFETEFSLNDEATWSKFPYALKEYGWVYDKGAADVKPDRYQVSMKTANGDSLSAVYSKEGTLIATREEYIDGPVPQTVLDALSKSKYKGWAVVGNKEIIRYYHDTKSVEQHFRLTVEKDKVRRSISFNYQAQGTANK